MLGMQWNEGVYIDACLPLGLRSAPKLFNILTDLLAWISKQCRVSFLIHYIDFLTVGPPSSSNCQQNLNLLYQICKYLGVPFAIEKIRGPSTVLPLLLDTIRMEARLSEEKLARLKEEDQPH